MSLTPDSMSALAEEVAVWRMQESIFISLGSFYTYYVITTMAEEVSLIVPQKWNRGKTLYAVIRYGALLRTAIALSRNYRNYFIISLEGCKALGVTYVVANRLVALTCDFSLALCLGALLHANLLQLTGILALSCGLAIVNGIFDLVGFVQYPAEPVSRLDRELGYPCYVPSAAAFSEHTISYAGLNMRAYLNLATTILLTLLGVATLLLRYRGQGSRLIQVLRRDGGMHYLSLLAFRLSAAIIYTPESIWVSQLESSPAIMFITASGEVIIPILAQRLLINMRKIDYMGSQPIAPKLLFAPATGSDSDELEDEMNTFELAQEGSRPCHQMLADETYAKKDAGGATNSFA